jgi:hypothetical protein
MNYTICLDPLSTNFDPTNLSNGGLGSFSVYTNADGFTTPVATNIPLSALFPPPTGTCPYTINGISNDATQLLIVDQCVNQMDVASIFNPDDVAAGAITTECCYSLIDISDCTDWCAECGIEFDVYDPTTVGRIIAGNLISTCGTVTDYVIGWYLNGNYSAPAITTGFGSTFNYQFPHPLTIAANTAPMVVAGNYEGIIHDVIINGTTYSSISGSGNGTNIPFNSCFETAVVSAFECDNGTFPLPYTHQVSLTATGNGVAVPPISATYNLSLSTIHFAYQFTGYNIYDNLTIKFKSGNPSATTNPTLYTGPIYLENLNIGSDVDLTFPAVTASNLYYSQSFTSGVYPKTSVDYGGGLKRVLSLTGLERTATDQLEILITPNPVNPQTSWQLKMQCLDTFDCEDCTFDSNPPRKITSINLDRVLASQNPCLNQKLIVNASGCFAYSSDLDYVSYYGSSSPNQTQYPWNYISLDGGTQCNVFTTYLPNACDIPKPATITFNKTNVPINGIASNGAALGQIYMTFDNAVDYLHYKNELLNQEATLINSIGPIVTNCNDYKYYAGYKLIVPQSVTPNSVCGDPNVPLTFYVHRTTYPNIVFVENNPSGFWSITIPMPEVADCLSFGGCTDCYGWNKYKGHPTAILNLFNSSSFASLPPNTVSQTNNNSSKYTQPWGTIRLVTGSVAAPTSYSGSGGFYGTTLPLYSVQTIPFVPSAGSPTGWTILPNLGGTVCSSSLIPSMPYSGGLNYNIGYSYQSYWYNVSMVFPNLIANSTDPRNNDFKLFTQVINNSGSTVSPAQLIYTYTSSVVTVNQPNFFAGGSPTLTIDPF